jgi:hypothetical protein
MEINKDMKVLVFTYQSKVPRDKEQYCVKKKCFCMNQAVTCVVPFPDFN